MRLEKLTGGINMVIRIAPKKRTSNRVCPYCGDRGTKIFHLSRGNYQCQRCDSEYPYDSKLKRNPIFG